MAKHYFIGKKDFLWTKKGLSFFCVIFFWKKGFGKEEFEVLYEFFMILADLANLKGIKGLQ